MTEIMSKMCKNQNSTLLIMHSTVYTNEGICDVSKNHSFTTLQMTTLSGQPAPLSMGMATYIVVTALHGYCTCCLATSNIHIQWSPDLMVT